MFNNPNVILKEGTEQFDRFLELPQPLSFKVYIFNITNPDDVINNGALPMVQEVGPYVYKFLFLMMDLSLQSVLKEVEELGMLAPINEIIDDLFGENSQMIMRTTPRKLLFEGMEFCWPGRHGFADLICEIVKTQMTETMIILPDGTLSFAMLRHKNMTNNGVFRVHTGLDEPRDVHQIITWEDKTHNDVWPDNDDGTPSVCNQIKGSDGSAFRPLQETGETAFIFNTDIC
uniref:Sensory neuron membrane protein 2 n=1 Tax=Phlebotomus papatasi TaxID=29031 RepID=A0A1B0DL97_PHLPP